MTTYYCPSCKIETGHKAAGEGRLRCVPCGKRHMPVIQCNHDWDTDSHGLVSCHTCRRVP